MNTENFACNTLNIQAILYLYCTSLELNIPHTHIPHKTFYIKMFSRQYLRFSQKECLYPIKYILLLFLCGISNAAADILCSVSQKPRPHSTSGIVRARCLLYIYFVFSARAFVFVEHELYLFLHGFRQCPRMVRACVHAGHAKHAF